MGVEIAIEIGIDCLWNKEDCAFRLPQQLFFDSDPDSDFEPDVAMRSSMPNDYLFRAMRRRAEAGGIGAGAGDGVTISGRVCSW